MSLYLEQIRQLVALQHVDDGIHAVHAELEAAPKEVEALEKRFAAQDSQRNWIIEKVQHLQEQQKRLDADIEDDESRLTNSKNKLMQVENDREYQAMVREMDNMDIYAKGKYNRPDELVRTMGNAFAQWDAVRA